MDTKVSDLLPQDITPFPPNLYFFVDPDDPFDLYQGFISCFQFYDNALSPSQIQAMEFCPDRIGMCFFASAYR